MQAKVPHPPPAVTTCKSNAYDVFVGEPPQGALDRGALLVALADPARAARLDALVAPSPLLQHRVRGYHAVVRSGSAAAQRVTQTAKRVEWQLRRVYRLRNGIVHGAHFGGTGERLLEHLDSYVRAVLGPLSQVLAADNGIDTIEQAVAAIDAAFETWRQWAMTVKQPTVSDAARLLQAPYALMVAAADA